MENYFAVHRFQVGLSVTIRYDYRKRSFLKTCTVGTDPHLPQGWLTERCPTCCMSHSGRLS